MSTAHRILFALSFLGSLACYISTAASTSGSLPAILFGIAGFGFAAVSLYFIFVLSEVDNK